MDNMSDEDTKPDDGIVFYGQEPEEAPVAVEEKPDDPTGDQDTQDDATPTNGDTTGDDAAPEENSDADNAEVETEAEKAKKMQHAMRVQAFENRELKRKLREFEASQAAKREESEQAPQQVQNDASAPRVPRMSDEGISFDEEKYAEKLEEYHRESAAYHLRKHQADQERQRREAEARQVQDKFVKDSSELQAADPAYAELVQAGAGVQFSDAVRESVLNSEQGAKLHYELLKDPDRLDRINQLPPLSAMREILKIETGLVAQKAKAPPAPKKVSSAPEPIEVSSGVSTKSPSPSEGLTYY